MKKKSLKFKKALAYYKNNLIVALLEDGRYALVDVSRLNAPNHILKGEVSHQKIYFMRGKELSEDIPEDWIEKAKQIIEDPNSRIRELSGNF